MGKRRNAEKKNYNGGRGENPNPSTNAYGDKGKLAVFDFADDDLRVEYESRKNLAKFGAKSPSKKPANRRQPLDKYRLLELLSQGNATQLKDSARDVIDVDVTDSAFRDRSFGTDIRIPQCGLTYDSLSYSFFERQGLKCYACAAKPCAPGGKSGGYSTAKKHVQYVDSDEDGRMELSSSSSSFSIEQNEGSLEEHSSEYGANNNDCEAVVVVAPYYVKYANMHYTRCLLTFSQRCIRLEGSPLSERKRSNCLEWSTFDILKIEHQQCESVKADVVNLHLNSMDINVADAGNCSGSVELEFVILDDPQWSKKLEDIKSLDLKYKALWKTIVSECNFDESFEDIIYPDGDPDAVFISRKDVELLQPRTFINDTIIDFYIKYLVNKTNPEKQHRFHFFNTFFFQKLVDMNRDLSRPGEGSEAFQRVRKWTRNVHIFEKDYIFIPVNFSLHWSLIVICHPGGVANLRDKGTDDSSEVPCIIHMDSIRGSHRGLETLIRSYLWEEWKERGHEQEEDISLKFLHLKFVSLQLPQQENLFDCGLFLLHYAELFLEQTANFSTIKCFDFLNKDWFLAAEVSLKKRDHIKKLIHRIVEDNALKDPRASRDEEHLRSSRYEGDSDSDFVQEHGVKELCPGIKLNSDEDFEINGPQSFLPIFERRNIDSSVIDESFCPDKLLVPIHQFNNMTLPMEDATASRCEADDDDKPTPSRDLNSFTKEKTKVSRETSSSKSLIIIDIQNEEDCVLEVSSSISSEDLGACIVEDSEDESETEGIIRTKKFSFT